MMHEMQQVLFSDEPKQAQYFKVHCFVKKIDGPTEAYSKTSMTYLSCLICKKKVLDIAKGFWCKNCNQLATESKPVYNFYVTIQDLSPDQIRVKCLGKAGEALLGMSAENFLDLKSIGEI